MSEETMEQVDTTNEANSELNSENASREERRAQHDFLRFKAEAKKLAEENENLKSRLGEVEKEKLLSQNRFKEAYELEVKRREEMEAELNTTKSTFWNGLKYQEIKNQALKAGIRSDAIEDLSLFDASEVEVETTSHGNANILGAKEFIEKLKMTRPYLFQDNRPPNINGTMPTETKAKELSAMDLLKMQRENPAKYRDYVKSKYLK